MKKTLKIGSLIVMWLVGIFLPQTLFASDYWIYRDTLTSGWGDWSWGGVANFENNVYVYAGAKAIKFDTTSPWGAISLQYNGTFSDLSQYAGVEFYLHGGSSKEYLFAFPTDINGVQIGPLFQIGETTNSWQRIFIPIGSFETASFSGIDIMSDKTGDFYIDELRLITQASMPPVPSKQVNRTVMAWLVPWDQGDGFRNITKNLNAITEVSPFWYTLNSASNVVPTTDWSGDDYVDPGVVSYLKSTNTKVIPTIANDEGGVYNADRVRAVIGTASARENHANEIVSLVLSNGYDGINIDYEFLALSDRENFTAFIQTLASAMRAQNKILAISLFPKTSEPGNWDAPQAQDYAALGAAVDQVVIMIYNYSWPGSEPGPVAPVADVENALAFAVSQIPREKVIHAIPLYGYDWAGSSVISKIWQDFIDLASTYGASVQWDSASLSPWFTYVDSGGASHTAWFENAASTDAKLTLAAKCGVGGIALWRIGHEDPDTWNKIRNRLGGSFADPTQCPAELSAAAPPQTTANAGVAINFTSVVSNTGNASTGDSFYNFFQVASAPGGGGSIQPLASTSMPTLGAGSTNTATSPSHTFASAGTYSVRACADKSGVADSGVIREANENNNCSAWTDVTVATGFDYSLAPSPTGALTIEKHESDTVYSDKLINKTLVSGTSESVNLGVSGYPSGVSINGISSQGCLPNCSSNITFAVTPSATTGTHPITVTGSSLNKTTQFNLIIQAAPPPPPAALSVTCNVEPSPATIGQPVVWTAQPNGGTPPFTYSWSGSAISPPGPNSNTLNITYSTTGLKVAVATLIDSAGQNASCHEAESTVLIIFDPKLREI